MIPIFIAVGFLVIYFAYKITNKPTQNRNLGKSIKSEVVVVRVEKNASLGDGLSYMTCAIIGVALFWAAVIAVALLYSFGKINLDWISFGKIWSGIKFILGLGILYLFLGTILDFFKKKD